MSSLPQECEKLISTLPLEEGWVRSHFYKYQGFWYPLQHLQGTISCQKHFDAQDSDMFLVTTPKSGTTWLKAIMFTLLNRKIFNPNNNPNHPLLTKNPHDLVLCMETDLPPNNFKTLGEITSSPRVFHTHMSYESFPQSAKTRSCKIVYLCRNPKDTFVSLWHFANKLRGPDLRKCSMGKTFDMFCEGLSPYGPYWDHVLEYWMQSKENPNKVFFLKYEELMEEPGLYLRSLAEFLGCGFSTDEEKSGTVEQILKLCSFDHMKSLKVNNNEVCSNGVEGKAFFRNGGVGDWKNYLDDEMSNKLDQIAQEKFHGSGLVFNY